MNTNDMMAEIRDANLNYLMLAQQMIRADKVCAIYRLGISAEIASLLETEQYARAKAIILERRTALDKIADALLEYETIDGKHVLEILEHGEIRSPVLGTAVLGQRPDDKGGSNNKKSADAPASHPLGGAPAPTPA